MKTVSKAAVICAVLLAASALGGCGLFGSQPGHTAPPKTYTPSPAPTRAVNSPKPVKTASQDTAGAATHLPEAATAAGATNNP